VNKANYVLLFLILFIFAAIFLRFAGLIDFSGLEMLSYVFMASGVAAVYASIGMDRKGILFTGSTLFLTGILIFINTRFDIEDVRLLVFPSVLLITGIGFFILYFDESSQKLFLIISIVFITAGLLFLLISRSEAFTGYAVSLWGMLKSYWIVVLISAAVVIILRSSSRTG
jgi:hypothetical protein